MACSFLIVTAFVMVLATQHSLADTAVSKQNHENTTGPLLSNKALGSSRRSLPERMRDTFAGKILIPHRKKIINLPCHSANLARSQVTNDGDQFMCRPCRCAHTRGGKIVANCSNLNLHTIPDSLPKSIWSLDMKGNTIRTFNTTSLLFYPSLNSLNLSESGIQRLVGPTEKTNKSKLYFVSKLETLDLSYNKLKTIEDGNLSLMSSLLFLQLEGNLINRISNHTFENIKSIRQLFLSNNRLRHIELSAFDSFTDLRELRLDKNHHLIPPGKQLNPRLFTALKKLRILDIRSTTRGKTSEYSTQALSELTNLNKLSCDGFKDRFGEKMSKLQHLDTLSIGPNEVCYLKDINATFFQNIPHLTSLQITECKIVSFDYQSFKFLPNLHSLSLRFLYNFDLSKTFNMLKGLTNSSLKILRLVRMYHSAPPCVFLTAKEGKYLPYFELEELDLSSNRLSLLRQDFLNLIPRSLKRLILVDNKLTLIGFILTQITFLHNLCMLDVSSQNVEKRFTYKDNTMGDHNEKYFLEYEDQTETSKLNCSKQASHTCGDGEQSQKSNYPFLAFEFLDPESAYRYEVGNQEIPSSNINKGEHAITHQEPFKIPKNLRILKASRYTSFGQVILNRRLAVNSLRRISFANSLLTQWGTGTLPRGIQSVDLEDNYCKKIRHTFFPSNNSVTHLNIKRNFLAESFARDSEGRIFSRLKKALALDMSMNGIYFLPLKFFRGLVQLNALRISDNKIQILNVSFSHMKSLQYLDVSRNSITWISRETRNDLDIIALTNDLRLDLVKNPLPCSCEGLEVLRWMATSRVHMLNKDYLQCRLPNGHIDYIGDLGEKVKVLQRQCASNRVIIISIVALGLLLFTAITTRLLYHYRWRLRYIKNIALSRWFGFSPPQLQANMKFKFDAYVVYSEEDRAFALTCMEELEEKRNHKLFFSDRDSLPGTFELNNITCAVHNSTATLLILTSDLLAEQGLHEYATQMALYESIYEHRDTLYILEPYPVPQDVITQELRLVKSKRRFTEWPKETEITAALNDQLWDEVSAAIGRVEINERLPSANDASN